MGLEVGSMHLQTFLVYLFSSLRSRRPDPASVTQRGWWRCSGMSHSLAGMHRMRGDVALLLPIYFRSRAEHLSSPSLGFVSERAFSGAWWPGAALLGSVGNHRGPSISIRLAKCSDFPLTTWMDAALQCPVCLWPFFPLEFSVSNEKENLLSWKSNNSVSITLIIFNLVPRLSQLWCTVLLKRRWKSAPRTRNISPKRLI